MPLKKAGREYKACCPFHDEKTPSFWVSPDKQFYHCFGCGAHGTALGFLMQYDRLPFPEAVEELAGRLGLTVPHEGGGAQRACGRSGAAVRPARPRVAEFYAASLLRQRRARETMPARRGLERRPSSASRSATPATPGTSCCRRFGDSAEQRRSCSRERPDHRARQRRRSGERYYDRFRDRLMFPIRDTRGRVIAFGGRVLGPGRAEVPELARDRAVSQGQGALRPVRIAAGAPASSGCWWSRATWTRCDCTRPALSYAVATLGTATTPEHLRRAFRLVSEMVFCFDGDRAGRAAAWRALQNALPEAREGREIRFLFLPEGEDPDSLVGSEGGEAFEARLAGALPLSEYLVAQLRKRGGCQPC